MIKSTSLASTITLLDMTLIARKETSATFSIEPLFIAAVFYLVINFLATRGVMMLEYRLTPNYGTSNGFDPCRTPTRKGSLR